jgi:hypothetical protein
MYYLDKMELYKSHATLFQHRKLHGKENKIISLVLTFLIFISFRFFNDTELKNSAKHKIEVKQNVFSLTVNKSDHPDVGTYHVHVDNGIDQTNQTAKLNVGGTLVHLPN